MRIAQQIELTENEFKTLTSWSRGRRIATRLMKRAKIVLMAAEEQQNKTIAELLRIDRRQVSRWRRRFVEKRLAGIEKDLPRGGRKAKKREQLTASIITPGRQLSTAGHDGPSKRPSHRFVHNLKNS